MIPEDYCPVKPPAPDHIDLAELNAHLAVLAEARATKAELRAAELEFQRADAAAAASSAQLQQRYDLMKGDKIDPTTGAITRAPREAAP